MASLSTRSAPKAVLFDAYGTLFDVYSVGAMAEQLFPGQGKAISVLWRDKQIEYTRLVTTSASAQQPNPGMHYQPFWELTRAALRYACAALQLTLGPEAEAALMNQYRALAAFPENKGTLKALKERAIPTGILSNGDPDMLGIAVRSAGLGDYLDHVISADRVKLYKTHPAVYALGPQTLGLPAKDILFVSSNSWDALGATWYGFQTLWINRSGLPFESLEPQPSRMGQSLRDVLSFFE
jgi:2-haloacid dehalogenase